MSTRHAEHAIDPLFLERWSPRAFDPSPISETELLTVLEAARWAPSSFNIQPWRFIYGQRDQLGWCELLDLLIPFNRTWAANASALIFIASERTMAGKAPGETMPSYSHSFDAGAAWACLALQAARMGLHAHAMTGFDVERAYEVLAVPPSMRVEAAVALGRLGDGSLLPDELRARERPSDRKPLADLVSRGKYSPAR